MDDTGCCKFIALEIISGRSEGKLDSCTAMAFGSILARHSRIRQPCSHK
jgi:hypothetical protein